MRRFEVIEFAVLVVDVTALSSDVRCPRWPSEALFP